MSVASGPVRLFRHAPILLLPGIFAPELCARLAAMARLELPTYGSDGFTSPGHALESGSFRVRHAGGYGDLTEVVLRDQAVTAFLDGFVERSVIPVVADVFQSRFSTREDWRLASYAAPGGFLEPHRDSPSPQTAHRRFTLTVNLNAGDYDGGELCFPEFGPDLYAVERGTAMLWSAKLLHAVRPVTRGTRIVLGVHLADLKGQAGALTPPARP